MVINRKILHAFLYLDLVSGKLTEREKEEEPIYQNL